MAADFTITPTETVLVGTAFPVAEVNPELFYVFAGSGSIEQRETFPKGGPLSDRPSSGYLFPRGNRFP